MPQGGVCCPLVVLVLQHGAVGLVFFQCQETYKPAFLFPSPLLLREFERELEGTGGVGGWKCCKCSAHVFSVAFSSALTLETHVRGPERTAPTLSLNAIALISSFIFPIYI